MSLFEDASLVVTPNGRKAGKVYSIKPTDGSGDLTVVRATTKTEVNASGVIVDVPINVPSFDYTNGSCPSILVEPQRTNLVRFSEQFDNASWAKSTGVTVTANVDISPDGTMNADRIVFTGVSQFVNQFNTLTAVPHYGSVSVKGTLGETIRFVVGGTEATRTLTGEWQRIELLRATAPSNGNFTISTFANATARDILIWGAQLEAGANATSYIPTTSATVTRNADVISKTGISDLIGQTEGTLFVDVDFNYTSDTYSNLISINNNINTQAISLNRESNNRVQFFIFNSGVQANLLTTNNSNGKFKIIGTYKSNEFKLFVNGVLIGTDTSGTLPTLSTFNLGNIVGSSIQKNNINSAVLWKTALTEQECINLTSI